MAVTILNFSSFLSLSFLASYFDKYCIRFIPTLANVDNTPGPTTYQPIHPTAHKPKYARTVSLSGQLPASGRNC